MEDLIEVVSYLMVVGSRVTICLCVVRLALMGDPCVSEG